MYAGKGNEGMLDAMIDESRKQANTIAAMRTALGQFCREKSFGYDASRRTTAHFVAETPSRVYIPLNL